VFILLTDPLPEISPIVEPGVESFTPTVGAPS
jgi:hypothetical protein